MGRVDREPVPLRRIGFDTDRLRAIFYLVVVPVVVFLILVLGYLNHRSENSRAVKQAEANREQIVVLRHALGEACHATTVLYGITTALTIYIETRPDGSRPVPKLTTDALNGYATDLSSLTACQNVSRP
jgi:hypothetical protein